MLMGFDVRALSLNVHCMTPLESMEIAICSGDSAIPNILPSKSSLYRHKPHAIRLYPLEGMFFCSSVVEYCHDCFF